MMTKPSLPSPAERVNILGVNVGRLAVEQLIQSIVDAVEAHRKTIVVYVNIHAINLAQDLGWFMDFLNRAELAYCDGFGVMLGARILGYNIPERYTPPDWISKLASTCSQEGCKIYFLGARPGIAEKAAHRLELENPGLEIRGTHHGYFDKTPGSPENEQVIQEINACGADVLVLGFGMPAQEQWLAENWDRLNCCIALPIGAGFDYLAGATKRAPRWMTDHGLEWVGRLCVEPRRLWKRYLIGIPRFFGNIIKQRMGLIYRYG